MQKKALTEASDDNEILFEENAYNAEMICILGGSSKKMQKDLAVMDEIKTQLVTQMHKLGKPDYYDEERQLTIMIKVCKRIRDEFLKEKHLLEYQRDYTFINKDMVQGKSKKPFSGVLPS